MNKDKVHIPIWSNFNKWQKTSFSLSILYATTTLFLFDAFHSTQGDARKLIDIIMAPLYLCVSGILYLCKDANESWVVIYSLLQNKFLYTLICFICFLTLSGILLCALAKILKLSNNRKKGE